MTDKNTLALLAFELAIIVGGFSLPALLWSYYQAVVAMRKSQVSLRLLGFAHFFTCLIFAFLLVAALQTIALLPLDSDSTDALQLVVAFIGIMYLILLAWSFYYFQIAFRPLMLAPGFDG